MDFNKLTGQERCDHRRSQVSFSKAGQLHQAARGLHIAAGEFCLLTEALNFGQKPFEFAMLLAWRTFESCNSHQFTSHHICAPCHDQQVWSQEQLLFVENGAKLHCNYWADNEAGHLAGHSD